MLIADFLQKSIFVHWYACAVGAADALERMEIPGACRGAGNEKYKQWKEIEHEYPHRSASGEPDSGR